MKDRATFYATAPRGTVSLLRAELAEFGAEDLRPGRAGVRFRGTFEVAYRACLWSRIANRILYPVASIAAETPEQLYQGVRGVPWHEHLAATGSLAVDFVTSRSRIRHSRFGAQKVKDAVVDQFRERDGTRPSVELARPDLRINVHLDRDVAGVSVDLAGESLHRRGYRRQAGPAPLKENVAAAVLSHGGWRDLAEAGGALLDPMCGAGTLVVEAALMAADVAPGLTRDYYGFLRWRGFDRKLWQRLLAEARERRQQGLRREVPILGYDLDPRALARARECLQGAHLEGRVQLERRSVAEVHPPAGAASGCPGLVATNPPYGKRLGSEESLASLYTQTGEVLRERFQGWRVMLLCASPPLIRRLGLDARRDLRLDNGPLPCRLLRFDVPNRPQRRAQRRPANNADAKIDAGSDPSTSMFANRLRKNLRSVGRWARREGIGCYRLYDADMPEYAFALDVYESDATWLVAQEYQAPESVSPERAAMRRADVLASLPQVLGVPAERVVLKTRRRQPKGQQYQRLGNGGSFHEVHEHDCRLLVNFSERLDTGLFLDHRPIRRLIASLADGRAFLNLFAYTAAATVHAAMGGATRTTSIDLSVTYLDWARRNLELNGCSEENHRLIQADCLEWLREGPGANSRYGLMLLDCPTFSNSKRMRDTLDVQRDHVGLIEAAMAWLQADGVLLFSNHLKRFRMNRDALQGRGFVLRDITGETIPRDFARNPRVHHCWRITHAGAGVSS